MKSYFVLICTLLLFIGFSCDQKEQIHADPEIFTLTSANGNGFSFNHQAISMEDPDFLLIPQKVITGDAMSPFLSDPDLQKRFYLLSEFNDPESAQLCFSSSYLRLPEYHDFQQFARDLKPNQVWIVLTKTGSYGKILILDAWGNRSKNAPYAVLKFQAETIG